MQTVLRQLQMQNQEQRQVPLFNKQGADYEMGLFHGTLLYARKR